MTIDTSTKSRVNPHTTRVNSNVNRVTRNIHSSLFSRPFPSTIRDYSPTIRNNRHRRSAIDALHYRARVHLVDSRHISAKRIQANLTSPDRPIKVNNPNRRRQQRTRSLNSNNAITNCHPNIITSISHRIIRNRHPLAHASTTINSRPKNIVRGT